ncbi:MAG: UDP-N-acetylmuramoyl-L-alanyl-D-glutamate--2,6-diaminopimelate ligase [Clostridia bacterium]|nr:UDP-N-acetylmuramoyl-L-alanyl-D-glutamate--2,6-diaminopimelate ligase [Clostridia bacterium]
MRLSALLHKAKIEYTGADQEISRLICDSRAAEPGALFVCITGFASDGHAYAERAYTLGCRAFLAEKPLDLPEDATVILQENTRKALAKVSAAYYDFPAEKLKVIGITGTKGKTTISLMLSSILSQNGIPAGYIGSNGIDFAGNHYDTKNTTPESLDLHYYFDRMVHAGVQAVVIEVSSQALYLDRVYGIPFAAVAFTNLAHDHIGGVEHPTFEHYRDAKKKLFTEYSAEFAVYNAEDANAAYMLDGSTALLSSFGLHKGDFHAAGIEPFFESGALGVSFTAHALSESCEVRLQMPGQFSVANALCAMAIARRFGICLADSAAALAHTAAAGRFEVVATKLPAVFVIDYAHNGFSLTSALTTLRAYAPKRLWCVTGSVGGRTKSRRGEIGEAVSLHADVAVLTADNPDFEDPMAICEEIRAAFVRDIPCTCIPDRAEALRYVAENAREGDIVLLAGKGHENYQLIRGGNIPFSERMLIERYAMEISAELV